MIIRKRAPEEGGMTSSATPAIPATDWWTDWWTHLCEGPCSRPRTMPRGQTVCLECLGVPATELKRKGRLARGYRLFELTNLRAVRLAQGMDQEELARISGVSRVTISNIETGRNLTREHTAEVLAAALMVSVEDLL